MQPGHDLLKKLGVKFEPSALVNFRFRGKDIVVKTDEQGNATTAFIGKINDEGIIKGDRYSRKLLYNRDGTVLKDHWDYKGKVR